MSKAPKTGMKPPLDCSFDFALPYGYIASEKIEALAAKHERRIDWHPILPGIVFKHAGGAALTEFPPKGTDGEPFCCVDRLGQVERWLGTDGW
jgi:2-hydroxychromene-2-carboxylate isomerase